MGVVHVGLVLYESSKCEFKGFYVVSSYKRKIQKDICKDNCDIMNI